MTRALDERRRIVVSSTLRNAVKVWVLALLLVFAARGVHAEVAALRPSAAPPALIAPVRPPIYTAPVPASMPLGEDSALVVLPSWHALTRTSTR